MKPSQVKGIFDKLSQLYNIEEFEDEEWIEHIRRWADLKEEQKLDYSFVLNMCYGHWDLERQKNVWQKVRSNFERKCGADLRKLDESTDLGAPLPWQKSWIRGMARYLREKHIFRRIHPEE